MRVYCLFDNRLRFLVLIAALVAADSLRGADATFYAAVKGLEFNQTDAGPPVLAGGNPYRFLAIVGLTAPNAITNATVQSLPSGPINSLVAENGDFEFQDKFATLGDLDSAYPDGGCQVVIDAFHDGIRTATLHLSGDTYPSAAPHVSDFANAQAINPGIPFTLSWDAFNGGTTNDFVQLTIANNSGTTIFQSPTPGQPGALNGTSNSVVIPAGRLPAQTTNLNAQVLFVKTVAVDSNSYPGVIGVAGYVKATDFAISTTNSTPAQDVTSYVIYKQQNFIEDEAGVLSPDPAGAFRFTGLLAPKGLTDTTLSNANLELPNGSVEPLPFSTSWFLMQSFTTESDMDAAFPSGVYTFSYDGVHDFFQSLPLTLPTNSFPAVPHVNNLPAAQTIDPAASFNLTWDPIPGFVTGTFLILVVADSRGTNILTQGFLPGATNYIISANKLQPGQSYTGTLQFQRLTNSISGILSGVSGSVYFKSQTSFNLATIGGSSQPQLTVIPPTGSGQFQLQLTGQTNQLYAIEASTNLQPGSWVPLATNPATGGQFVFPDNQSSNFPVRYYRGRLVQ